MSIDRSLKTGGGLSRHRNVLTRTERIARLKDEEKWAEGKSLFGLPKVANRNVKVAKKAKKKEEEAAAAAAAPGAAPVEAKPKEAKAKEAKAKEGKAK
jgi:small basic protein (TIGR04137 family)